MEAKCNSGQRQLSKFQGQMQEVEHIGLGPQKISSSCMLHECLKCEHACARVYKISYLLVGQSSLQFKNLYRYQSELVGPGTDVGEE